MTKLLIQPENSPLDLALQVSLLFAGNQGLLDNYIEQKYTIHEFQTQWILKAKHLMPELYTHLNKGNKLDKTQSEQLIDIFKISIVASEMVAL